jgi:site-specific recombinase XerD
MTGIKTKLHSHLARHTFATFMLDKGVPIEHVSKMLGHTNITQTQRYAKVKPKAIYDDFDRVATMLAKATEPTKRKKKKQ